MTSKLALFDQTLTASLLQPLSLNQQDFKAYQTRIRLRLLEQRSESSGEKELKFEISRSDDIEFLFAEVLNNEKYQKLAREHELTVDFDTFPKVIIQHLLCKNIVHNQDENGENDARKRPGYHSIIESSKPTEINIILDAEKNFCSFELLSKTPISKGRIFSMKLLAVRGDQLIAHLLKICSSQRAKLSTLQRASEELEPLKKRCSELEKEKNRLEEIEEKFEETSEKIRDLENELELVKEEKETIRVFAEEKEDSVTELQNDNETLNRIIDEKEEELGIVEKILREEQAKTDQVQNRNAVLQKEMSRLRAEIATLTRNLQKADVLLKRNDQQQNQQSLDIRKLKELEEDLKQKDSMVESLSETSSLLRKELEDEKLKMKEVMDSFEKLKAENEKINERLQVYRQNRFSPATGVPTAFTPVFKSNSPFQLANRTPFRDTTQLHNAFTPASSTTPRNLSTPFADDTTGSTMTNTPPVIRRI